MGSPRRPFRACAALVVLAVALTGCAGVGPAATPDTGATATTRAPSSTATTPTVVVDTAWAARAERFLGAFVDAINDYDPDLVMSFFTTTARVTDAAAGGTMLGETAIESFLESLVDGDGFTIDPGPIFLGWRSALMPVRIHDAPLDAGPSAAALLSFTFIDDRIAALDVAYPLPVVASTGVVEADAVAAAEYLYAGYVEALAAGDDDQLGALYWRSAWWRDELSGVRMVGAEAIIEETRAMLETTPGVTFTGRTVLPTDGEPSAPELYADAGGVVYARYDLTTNACAMSVISAWTLDARGILSDRIHYDAAGYRSCSGALTPPEGWWRDATIPTATRTLTGTLRSGDIPVDLYNASPTQAALVEWALGRFAAAGLDPPALAAVTFPPTTLCRHGHTGLAISTGDRYEVALCVTDDEICDEGDCSTPSLVAGRAVVHELAHVWTAATLSDADREAFLAARGLDAWTGEDVAWADRGTEHAAEILTWGVMDPPVAVDRMPDAACDRLSAAYRALTGIAPLPGRAGC
jgi:hypothetical protein